MAIAKDLVSLLIEEIALEGLDGITIQALWVRLEDRPEFGLKPLSGKVKLYIWSIMIKLSCIQFYCLPEPRKELVIFDKINSIDSHGQNVLPEGYEDIYPHAPVTDENAGVMGSSKDYSTRTKVTSEAVKCTLVQAFTKWGMQLVMVADQEKRRRALCGPDSNPSWEFFINEYCILERVGRSRQHGEITQGPWGLKLINDDNKTLFYYRKCLVKRDLITVQNLSIRIKNNNVSGKIIHLKRFSVPVKSKFQLDSEVIIDYLKLKPDGMALYQDISKLPIKTDVKKILKKSERNFISEFIPYRRLYPDALPAQWKCKGSSAEKSVKVIRLISDLKEEEEEDKDDEEDYCGLLDESYRYVGVPLVRQAYLAMEHSHITGLTQNDIARYLGVPNVQARSICKQLKRAKVCGTILKDVGRQRVGVIYCTKFDTLKASIPNAVACEKSKLMEIISLDKEKGKGRTNQESNTGGTNKRTPKILRAVNKAPDESTLKTPSQTTKIILKKNHVEDDIKTEIVVIKPNHKIAKTPGLLDVAGDSSNLSLRLLKRANLILKAVNNLKIIHDVPKLLRMINEEEELEGSNYTVDRKSILRIIEKLELEGHLQRIKVTLTGSFKEKVFTFICHPSVTPQHSEIQSAIEQAKMKLPIITKDTAKYTKNPVTLNTIKQLQYDHRVGKTQYGFKPKFIRLRNMHFYLYYLIYNYSGEENLTVITKRNILSKNNFDESLLKEMGQVYLDKLDWKMFIPPLPFHEEYGEGWCLVSDILLRLPLFMFLSIVNIPYRIPGIMEYLEHPLKRYFLVKDLPTEISYHLTIMRKYIFTITDILQQLAYIGLLQFGPQMMKEKDQVFIYLNKNAQLVNTSPSEEGYNHISKDIKYEMKRYHFSSTDDLESYWSDLVKFAMNTKLGSKACVVGKEVVVETVNTKKQMIEALKPRSAQEAVEFDIGYIPGDGLGAAGIDSDLFVHLKRNWYWSSSLTTSNKREAEDKNADAKVVPSKKIKPEKPKDTKIEKSKKNKKQLSSSSKDSESEQIKGKNSVNDSSNLSTLKPMTVIQKTPIVHNTVFQKKCHKKVTRLMLPYKKSSCRKPYYDQQDKEALKRMKKLRVDWTPKEDNILLLCKAASVFMCPYALRKTMKNYTEIREFLHKVLPQYSLNKTSRACQRRITYMMKNPYTAHSVAVCVEELNQDKELVSKYGHATMHRLLNKLKDTQQSSPGEEFRKIYDKLYLELVHILTNRLKSMGFTKSVLQEDFIPDSLDEFYIKYKVAVPCPKKRLDIYSHAEVENTNDIMSSVVKTILTSSLACVADKTCYSYQLLHIYQQYPDSLLRNVMNECRSSGILAIKKYQRVMRNRAAGFKALPVTSTPFKLSNFYMNRLQTKFQHQIYSGSYNFFSNLITQLDSGDTDFEMELTTNNGGECALIISLYSLGLIQTHIEFPEQVIILDPKLSETEESFSRVLKRFNDLISNMKSKNQDSRSNKGYETDFDDIDDSKYESNYEEFNYSNKSNLASAASRLAVYTLRDECSDASDTNLQHAHDYFVINPCKVSISLKADDIDNLQSLFTNFQVREEILACQKKLSILPNVNKRPDEQVIHESLNPLTSELLEFIKQGKELGVKTSTVLQVFGDEIIANINDLINSQLIIRTGAVSLRLVHYKFLKLWVILSYSLPRSVKDSLVTGSDRVKDLKEMGNASSTLSFDKNDDNVTSETSDKRENNRDSLNNSGLNTSSVEEGAPESSTVISNKRKEIEGELANDILPPRKKVRSYTKFSKENMAKFSQVIESKSLKDMEVLIKPWIRVDGSLNRRVLDRLLGSVLGHICYMPGLSIEKLQMRFSPAIQPSHTHELVLILSTVGCVKLLKLDDKSACSLFSSKAEVVFVTATGLEESHEVIVEPDPMAIVKLGLFIGDKAYAGVYMDPENFAFS